MFSGIATFTLLLTFIGGSLAQDNNYKVFKTVTFYEPVPTGTPLVSSNVALLTVMASMVFMAVVIIVVLALFNQVDCCNTTT